MIFFQRKFHRALEQIEFYKFIWSIPQASFANYDEIQGEIHSASDAEQEAIASPLVKRGLQLRTQAINNYQACLKDKTPLRILIHRPDQNLSPGGYSLFGNLAQSLNFIGIETQTFASQQDFLEKLQSFEPNVLISSDHPDYLRMIDWLRLKDYRQSHTLRLGLTASLEEYGNSPLPGRLEWGRRHQVDFYYSFRSQQYVETRPAYEPFHKAGLRILTVEFGANPLIHYPASFLGPKKYDYVFLASINRDKWQQYFTYLPRILRDYIGILSGPGWTRKSKSTANAFDFTKDRFIYARCKVGLNLHISDSLDWPCELNERTYILASVGIPQLVDEAKLLGAHFSPDSLFIASGPNEYYDLFRYILQNPEVAERRAMRALEDVYERHTTFQRAEGFARGLMTLL